MVHLTVDSILDSIKYGTKFGPHPSLSPKWSKESVRETEMKNTDQEGYYPPLSSLLNGKKAKTVGCIRWIVD